jgi:hypothetical protein
MDYGVLIREAWLTTRRHRFLWILGLFAGGSVGVSLGGGNGRGGGQLQSVPVDAGRFAPGAALLARDAEQWAAANGAVVVGALVGAVLLGLALLIVAVIAQGGMAEATVDLARGRPSSLAVAWRAGRRLFWRYAGLYVLVIGAALVAAVVVGLAVVAGIVPIAAAASVAPSLTVPAILVLVPLALVTLAAVLAAAVALSVVVAYAQRAVYAEDAGPLAALRAGWRVLRDHPGDSIVIWLINLALVAAAGIVLAVGFAVVAAVLSGLGVAVWTVAAAAPPRLLYAVLAAGAALAAGALAVAVANTFFWNYWTLAYLRLTQEEGGAAAAA